MRFASKLARLGAVTALVLAALPAAVGGTKLVDEVVRMLEQQVDPAVIGSWIDLQDVEPGSLTPDDLIRLSKAGAPKALVQKILARSTPKPAATTRPPVVAAPAAPAPAAAPEGTLPVRFTIGYEPFEGFQLEDQDDLDLYVYLDGRLLSHAESQSGSFHDVRLRLERPVEPGPHEIRLLREHHKEMKKRGAVWRHEAEVCPDAIAFELAEGHEWAIEIDWVESNFSSTKTPLTWRVLRDGEQTAGVEKAGTPKADWPPLCEDLASRYDPAGKIPTVIRRALDRCVSWASLWNDSSNAPSRRQVLAEIETPVARDGG